MYEGSGVSVKVIGWAEIALRHGSLRKSVYR